MRDCRGKHHEYLVTSLDYLNKEKHGEVWIVVENQCLRDTAAHDNVVTGDEDRARLSTKAAVSCHTIVARVLYARLPITE